MQQQIFFLVEVRHCLHLVGSSSLISIEDIAAIRMLHYVTIPLHTILKIFRLKFIQQVRVRHCYHMVYFSYLYSSHSASCRWDYFLWFAYDSFLASACYCYQTWACLVFLWQIWLFIHWWPLIFDGLFKVTRNTHRSFRKRWRETERYGSVLKAIHKGVDADKFSMCMDSHSSFNQPKVIGYIVHCSNVIKSYQGDHALPKKNIIFIVR